MGTTEVAPQWPSSRYDLVKCNCITFCDELLALLGAEPVPAWVKGLHETGAALLRVGNLINIKQLSSRASLEGSCVSSSVAGDDLMTARSPDGESPRSSSKSKPEAPDDESSSRRRAK